MIFSKPIAIAALLCTTLIPSLTASGHVRAQAPGQWVVPAGFQVTVFADSVENAREMALGPRGTVFVGSMRAGKVHAVVDRDGDHKADRVVLIASGLDQPNGVAVRNGALYVATASKILRYDDIERHLDSPPAPVVVRDSLPNPSAGHTWKFIAFGPDDLLYMGVGAPCNVCLSPPMVSTILRMKPDGSGLEVFAEGVRNSVGFDWHPTTHEMWFTDNGRDMLGDDVPPDELNHAAKAGLHFGFPYCQGGDIADPKFGAGHPCGNYQPPAQKLGPHVASIGMRFYTGTMFPPEYRNQIFIAEHGSWNRSTPIGYRVTVVKLDAQGKAVSYQPFAEGWLQRGEDWGRPADVLVMPDGALLVSDDHSGVIYRITYAAPHKAG